MGTCQLCGTKLPYKRRKFCSTNCIKRSWYIKNFKGFSSVFIPKTYKKWMDSNTGKGFGWEEFICNLSGGKRQPFGSTFDILCNGEKLEVKSSELYKRKIRRGKEVSQIHQIGVWVFHPSSINQIKTADFFICIGLINGKPIKIFKIPSGKINPGGITISPRKSKYDQFLFRV